MNYYVRVNSKGGITIPVALRRQLSIKKGDVYTVGGKADQLELTRDLQKCVFCGKSENDVRLQKLKEQFVCDKCAIAIKKLVEE